MSMGSGYLLNKAGRTLGKRLVRDLGIPKVISAALGEPTGDAPRRARSAPPPRPLHVMDKATERAVGERAFQAALAHLDVDLPPGVGSALAQAIAHAVVEALDEYLSRENSATPVLREPEGSGPDAPEPL